MVQFDLMLKSGTIHLVANIWKLIRLSPMCMNFSHKLIEMVHFWLAPVEINA